MVAVAGEDEREARLAGDGVHHAKGSRQPVEDRALLDVELEVRERSRRHLRIADLVRMQAVGPQCVADGHAMRVRPGQDSLGLADQGQAADEWHAEAHAFLVREADHLDVDWQPAAGEQLHEGDPEDHTEHAVVGARIRHRVQVGADDHGRPLTRLAAQVAGLVDADRHAERFHPRTQVVVHVAHRRRQERPGGAARILGSRRDPLAAFNRGPGCVEIWLHHEPRYVLYP